MRGGWGNRRLSLSGASVGVRFIAPSGGLRCRYGCILVRPTPIVVELIEYSQCGPQAGGSLHGILLAIPFQVFGKLMNGPDIKSCLFADGSGLISPANDKEFQATRLDGLVLVIGALFVL